MPRDPDFISKTSDLEDHEVAKIKKAIEGHPWLVSFYKGPTGWIVNINPKRHTEWTAFWGKWKSILFQERLLKRESQ